MDIAVFYAKIVDDKEEGVYMAGVYFGGIAPSKSEADAIARECVNTVKGGSVIPKVQPIPENYHFMDVMQDVIEKFRALESELFLTEETLEATSVRSAKKRAGE